ncbi:MAG: hypothetical protein P4L92_19320 [Rudaea sp.]|nr:hypothetical protein [Rudaea sp.]
MPFVTIIAIGALTLAATGPGEFSQSGTMKIGDGPQRSASLHVGCSADPDGGALVIELIATEANTRKDFDYDDFEGPDAPAGAKALSHVTWKTNTGTTDITHTAAGSYLPEPPESFMFGIDQLSRRRGPAATLLAAVGTDSGQLVWTQTGFDARHKLIATFALDAAATQHLHDAVAACLPATKPP